MKNAARGYLNLALKVLPFSSQGYKLKSDIDININLHSLSTYRLNSRSRRLPECAGGNGMLICDYSSELDNSTDAHNKAVMTTHTHWHICFHLFFHCY